MYRHLHATFIASFALGLTAFAGDNDKKTVVPTTPEADRWKFLLAVPGWMPGVEGTVGLNGVNSNVNIGFNKILPKVDMIWATRAEVSKGRFGVLGELIYLSMSGSAGSDTVIKKVDVRVDEYLADLTLRYRLIEGERGYVDALAGVRYTNLYQAVTLQSNDQRIGEVAENFTAEVSARLRERIEQTLSEGRFRNAIKAEVGKRINAKIATITGPEPHEREVPNAPLAYRTPGRVGIEIERLVHRKEGELVEIATAELKQAEAAEKAAIQQAVAAERARLQRRAAALRARVDQRIATAQKELEKSVKKVLTKNLNQHASRSDDWWDPYIGVRARYNFTPAIYVIGRGDIGGFGIGSDLMWQAEAAVGFQLTRRIYTEIGYRALSFDYEKNGLTYDTITHGAQVTTGIIF
jgi:hypothetical protein